ncbi:SDR family oxidoreductase [Cryptosporangium sp. NPDC048952]|uniref:SDR family oxidoreductase n=1 Tax=Cryptosporangium sp. NPDC048952 TaxID=3363961 RepID=UPI0037122CA3
MTGSGNGIGEAIVRRFAAEGARVVVTDIEPEAVERVSKEIGAVGLAADITVAANVRAVADLARETYGEIDIWFSNAGVSGPSGQEKPDREGVWSTMWQLHVMAHLHAVQEVLPSMLARGEGYLLQTASSIALSTQLDKAAYTVTKRGALALSEWLAVRYRPDGINVSCFCPGPMLTRMLLDGTFPSDHPAVRAALTPEQVADVVCRGIADERFLILTQEGADRALVDKGTDYDAWIDTIATTSLGRN